MPSKLTGTKCSSRPDPVAARRRDPSHSIRKLGRFLSMMSATFAALDELAIDDDPLSGHIDTADLQSP